MEMLLELLRPHAGVFVASYFYFFCAVIFAVILWVSVPVMNSFPSIQVKARGLTDKARGLTHEDEGLTHEDEGYRLCPVFSSDPGFHSFCGNDWLSSY